MTNDGADPTDAPDEKNRNDGDLIDDFMYTISDGNGEEDRKRRGHRHLVNDRPIIDLNGDGDGNEGINNAASSTEDGGAVTLAPDPLVLDVDSANLTSAQIKKPPSLMAAPSHWRSAGAAQPVSPCWNLEELPVSWP